MTRPLAFDTTHLVSRLRSSSASGIERVDIAYARHFAQSPRLACGVHYGLRGPHTQAPQRVTDMLGLLDRRACDSIDLVQDDHWARVRGWLLGQAPPGGQSHSARQENRSALRPLHGLAAQVKLRVVHDRATTVPEGAVYLNVAQAGLEYSMFFRWLDRRPDLRPVFFLHDLLPLEYPEYFRRDTEAVFLRRVATIMQHARGIITTSRDVARRIGSKLDSLGGRAIPIHVQPLASPLEAMNDPWEREVGLANTIYYVVVSTIEPRKNHLMLLDVWRSLVGAGGFVPKLVFVGAPGWENAQVLDVLARSTALRPHVYHAPRLSRSALRQLVSNARALLMPSFAEGYGLPLVEALSLGTPVIASDIAAFREATQGCATFISPLDGAGWRAAVEAIAHMAAPSYESLTAAARNFVAPDWEGYFAGIEDFLDTL
jgi:glycosyltransferase involved in cell wall biosynthesis